MSLLGVRVPIRILVACCVLYPFLWPSQSWAALSDPFHYQATQGWERPSRLHLMELQAAFEKNGYWVLDRQNSGRIPWLPVDQVYVSSDFEKVIFAKQGLVPQKKSLMNQLIVIPAGLLFHAHTRDGDVTAFLFQNHSVSEVRKLLRELPIESPERSQNAIYSLIFPRAHGSGLCRESDPFSPALGIKTQLDSILSFQSIGTCLGRAKDGATEAARGAWDFAKTLFTEPAALWDNVVKGFHEFKEFALHAREEIRTFLGRLASVDPETALEMGCVLSGQIAFAALLVKTGVGAGQAIAQLASLLTKLKTMGPLFERLALSKKSFVATEVLACAVR